MGLRTRLALLRACFRLGLVASNWPRTTEEEGLAAYARGDSQRDCPYQKDDPRSDAWSQGYRRAGALDASVW